MPTINSLAQKNTPEANDGFMHYVLELVRLSGQNIAFRKVTASHTLGAASGSISLKSNDLVSLMCHKANLDATVFSQPDEIKLDRPLSSYLPLDANINLPTWETINRLAISSMLKAIVQNCPGLRPARVWNGTSVDDSLKRVPAALYGNAAQPPKQDTVGSLLATVKADVADEQGIDGSIVREVQEYGQYYAFMNEKWDRLSPFPTSKSLLLAVGEC